MSGCERSGRRDTCCPRRLTERHKAGSTGGGVVISEAHFRTRVYELNPIGFHVWEMCDGQGSIREICADLLCNLSEETAPSLDQLEDDVFRFVEKLREEWLVEWTSCS